jgi:cytochrome c2
MKLIYLFLISLLSVSLYAKDGMTIFKKKCGMCHKMYKPHTKEDKQKLVAPPIQNAIKNMIISINDIELPKDESELKQLANNFLVDYIQNPSKQKGYCKDNIFNRFGTMPSLKGFINDEDLKVVVKWTIDNYMPKKNKFGKYEF